MSFIKIKNGKGVELTIPNAVYESRKGSYAEFQIVEDKKEKKPEPKKEIPKEEEPKKDLTEKKTEKDSVKEVKEDEKVQKPSRNAGETGKQGKPKA